MKSIRMMVLSAAMAIGAVTLIASPVFAADKKAPAKCDKDGKACKKGDDCKAENCKKPEAK